MCSACVQSVGSGNTITGIVLQNCSVGAHLAGSSSFLTNSNVIGGAVGVLITGSSVTVSGNIISNLYPNYTLFSSSWYSPDVIGISIQNATSFTVSNNTIRDISTIHHLLPLYQQVPRGGAVSGIVMSRSVRGSITSNIIRDITGCFSEEYQGGHASAINISSVTNVIISQNVIFNVLGGTTNYRSYNFYNAPGNAYGIYATEFFGNIVNNEVCLFVLIHLLALLILFFKSYIMLLEELVENLFGG